MNSGIPRQIPDFPTRKIRQFNPIAVAKPCDPAQPTQERDQDNVTYRYVTVIERQKDAPPAPQPTPLPPQPTPLLLNVTAIQIFRATVRGALGLCGILMGLGALSCFGDANGSGPGTVMLVFSGIILLGAYAMKPITKS
jgi:hypothetical protein